MIGRCSEQREAVRLGSCHRLGVAWILNHHAQPRIVVRSTVGASLTNVAFGGPDRSTLYCTESVSGSVLRAPLDTPGLPLHRPPS